MLIRYCLYEAKVKTKKAMKFQCWGLLLGFRSRPGVDKDGEPLSDIAYATYPSQ